MYIFKTKVFLLILSICLSSSAFATLQCSSIFPSALSNHGSTSASFVQFFCGGHVIANPDNFLATTTVSNPGGSCASTCPTADCIASGASSVFLDPGVFLAVPGGSPSLSVAGGGTGTAGTSGQVNYASVTVNGSGTLNFTSQGASTIYKIGTFNINNGAIINLVPGSYWVDTFVFGKNVVFNIVGTGTAKIYVNTSAATGSSVSFNVTSGITNPAKQLFLYAYSDFSIGSSSNVFGFIFSKTNITLNNNAVITGGVSAYTISVKNGAAISYDGAAIALTDFDGLCSNAPASITGFIITYDSNTGSYCFKKTITVTAKNGSSTATTFNGQISLSSTTNHGDWSLITGNGTFVAGVADSGAATYTYNASDLGVAVFGFTYKNGTSPVTANAKMTSSPSIVDNGTQGAMTLTEASLYLTSSAISGTPTTPPAGFATTETAGVTDTLYVTAYGLKAANTCDIITTYTGNKSLKFWSTYVNPSTGTLQYSVNGTSIATTQVASASQTVNFASGATSVPILYRDVGSMQISAKDTAFPCVLCSGTYTAIGSTANFVVKPAKFAISVVGNPGASTATGTVFTKAGQNFTTNVTAQDFAGNTTPNYGNETVAQSVNLATPTLVLPSGGHNGTLANGSAFTKTAPGMFQNTTANYNEVGIIQLNAEVAGQNYLGVGNVTSTSGNVGRFTPFSFTLGNNTPQFTTACASGSFTYLGQNFVYNITPQLTATAKSADGTTTTQNYTGAFFKLTSGSIGATYTTNSVGTTLNSSATSISVVDNANGSGGITFNSGSGLYFPKVNGTSIVPFTAEIKLAATVADTDSVIYASNPFNFGATTSGNGISFSNTKQFYEGRMYINSASGSELLSLSPNINLQYFASGSVWSTNTADNCTVFTDTSKLNLTYDNPSLTTTPTLGSISNGVIPLTLLAPGSGKVGNVSVEADLSATGANLPYLQYDWPYDGNNDGIANDNPRGLASFGIYQGKAFIVYQREVY